MVVPTVRFDNGLTTTIGPVEYSYKGPGGDGELIRQQIPLKLAWLVISVCSHYYMRDCICDVPK